MSIASISSASNSALAKVCSAAKSAIAKVMGAIYAAASWSTTWSATLDSEGTAPANLSMRMVVSAADISTSGTTIRVRFVAHSSLSLHINAASIGVRDTGANTVATPVQLLFSGSGSADISGGSTLTSDSLSFTLDETKDHIIVIDLGANNRSFKYVAKTGARYYAGGVASYNQASVTGFTNDGYICGFNLIEVQT